MIVIACKVEPRWNKYSVLREMVKTTVVKKSTQFGKKKMQSPAGGGHTLVSKCGIKQKRNIETNCSIV